MRMEVFWVLLGGLTVVCLWLIIAASGHDKPRGRYCGICGGKNPNCKWCGPGRKK
jgi:hypothetical protein